MLSNKPYLIRAFYEWIVDSDCTPYVVINANFPRVNVPNEYIENGEITLNVSPTAVRDLKIGNDFLEFHASFSGVVHIISAPIKSLLAIYANENQQGMFFDYEEIEDTEFNDILPSVAETSANSVVKDRARGHLKLVE